MNHKTFDDFVRHSRQVFCDSCMLLFLGTGLIAICGTFDFVWACILRHVKTLCTGSTPYRFHPNSYSTRSREKKGGGGGGKRRR